MVDCDATCWHTRDPQTRLITSDGGQELVSEGGFLDEYLPRPAQRTPLTSTGSFIQRPDQVEQPPAEQAA